MSDASEPRTVARFLLDALRAQGIETVFLVPGGMIDPFLRSFEAAGIRAIVTAHEAGAAYMADGYARVRRSFGVCMGIGGPGITNMITALAAAHSDRSPVLVIGGSIPREWEGLEAVQDSSPSGISDVTLLRAVTAFAQQIPLAEATPRFLRQALRAMFGASRRPAFLSVPLFMQDQRIVAEYVPLRLGAPVRLLDRAALNPVREALRGRARVVLLVGNGAIQSGAATVLAACAERWGLPVVTTLRAKGALSEAHPLSFGVFGIAGSLQATHLMLGDAGTSGAMLPPPELVIALGASLNEQNALAAGDLTRLECLIHVDIDPSHFEDCRYPAIPVQADVGALLEALLDDEDMDAQLVAGLPQRTAWLNRIRATPVYDGEADRHSDRVPLHPARIIATLRAIAPPESRLVVDSGAHTFFCAHHWQALGPDQCFVWTNNGPMGYAVAAAIGIRLAAPDRPCIALIGDGGMLMHGVEIQTAARYQVPIVVVVLNNAALGNVYLRAYREGHAEAMALTRSPCHDWVGFARSLGVEGERVERSDELAPAFARAFAAEGPVLVDVRCDAHDPTPNPGAAALM
jgi:acetolactate synthase I/II/III large subunit